MILSILKKEIINQLQTSPSPQLDTEILIEHFAGLNKTAQLLNRDKEISQEICNQIQEAASKRQAGLPIAYITGHKEFFGYDFYVSPAVLIPKPDTEILVENAIDLILQKINSMENHIITICDMCTGSGCIGLSVLKTLSEEYKIPFGQLPKITMVDISNIALEIAHKNAQNLLSQELQERVRFVRSNLFELLPTTFDVILTNPPYVPKTLVNELLQDGRSEPRLALDGDITITGEPSPSNDGLELIRNLTPQLQEHLSPYGFVIMETGEYNAQQASELAEKYGFMCELYKDLEGQLRGWIGSQNPA